MPITRRDVDAISEKRTLWDQGRGSVTGFGVRCQGQRRTFILKYNFEGRARWYTIGPFGSPWSVEEARTEAKRLLGIVASGLDPAADRKAKARPTKTAKADTEGPFKVGDLCDQYLAAARAGTVLTRFKRPKKASTLDIDEGRIARHIKPLIGQLPVTDLDRHRVHRMVADIAAGKTAVDEKTKLRGRARVSGGKTTASRVADLLSGIMTWAVDMSIVKTNPVHGVRRFRAQPRERFLSFEELGRLGEVLQGHFPDQARIHPYARAITELLCLSGCRLGEIVNLRWSEVDVPNQCLRLEDTKTGRSLRPVGRVVLERLRSIDRQAGSSFVFPASRGDGAYQGTKRQAKAIFEAAGIEGASSHTLRHTFGSVASDLGYSDATIAGLLGHAGRGVTSRYVHRPDDALRSAADAVAGRIAELLAKDAAHPPSRTNEASRETREASENGAA